MADEGTNGSVGMGGDDEEGGGARGGAATARSGDR